MSQRALQQRHQSNKAKNVKTFLTVYTTTKQKLNNDSTSGTTVMTGKGYKY